MLLYNLLVELLLQLSEKAPPLREQIWTQLGRLLVFFHAE